MSRVNDISKIDKDSIEGYECRHVTYCTASDGKSDLHVAKEYIHLKDGTRIPHMRGYRNFEREFWVTKDGFKNHNDKKEYEEEAKLRRYTTPQCNLTNAISRAMYGRPASGNSFRMIAGSPYLYGCDIASTSLVKMRYTKKYPDCITPQASVAVLDIETDVIRGTSEIILITLSYKNRIITAINKSFLPEYREPIKNSEIIIEEVLGDILRKRQAKVELVLCDSAADCCLEIFKRAHEWMPDFITVWNINFDLPIITATLTKAGHNLADVFSDPSVPTEYRFFKYIEGKKQKVTQSGKIMPLHWADRWHTVSTPASFYFLDAACLYKRVRIAKGMEPSYALDDILLKHIGIGKLNIPEAEHLDGLPWHIKMQRDHPFHYVAYNIFDCIGVEMLDEKTNDIAKTFPILCADSDFSNFTSNPRRIVDDMHYFYRDLGMVIATTGSDITVEDDEDVVSMKDWIVTLPAHLMDSNGLFLIKELPDVRSTIYVHNADIDIAGTYPINELVMNISKECTFRELTDIGNLTEEQRRELGVNLTGGVVNAIEIGVTAFGMPTPTEWLTIYDESCVV